MSVNDEGKIIIPPKDRRTIVVVGLGMVGIAFIEKLLDLDDAGRYRIITCGEETYLAYNRVALTEYFQHRSVEKLYLNKPEWYAAQDPDRFVFHLNEQVTSVDVDAHVVETSKHRIIPYDLLTIATGSDAALPPCITEGQTRNVKGIFAYRNISDLDKLIEYAEQEGVKGGRAVIVGGGLLGLEAAKAIHDLPAIPSVTIVNRSDFPLSRQLDADAGEMVLKRIQAMGVQILTRVSIEKVCTTSGPDGEVFTGFELNDGTHLDARIVILAIGITPRDDVARKAGIKCSPTHGIIVDDGLCTSAPDVYAIGECASWKGNTYGLIAPGIEMADILSFNLTQSLSVNGSFKARKMNYPDLSTKLKLVGVDVASFGDYFADRRQLNLNKHSPSESDVRKLAVSYETGIQRDKSRASNPIWPITFDQTSNTRANIVSGSTASLEVAQTQSNNLPTIPVKGGVIKDNENTRDQPVQCLTYKDPFATVYKKYIFTADGKHLLGGMMIGDVADFIKLVAIVKKKKTLDIPPGELISGSKKSGDDDGADLDDDTQICSCHNVTKSAIKACIAAGIDNIIGIKAKTKAGTGSVFLVFMYSKAHPCDKGCGGCMPLVTNIFNAEMKNAGKALNNNLCRHFAMSRSDLFNVVRIKKLQTLSEIMAMCGNNKNAVGCEICKPTIGSILSSLYNEHVMLPAHHQNQETNDRFLANIQRNGTFSVVPKIAAGEVTPEKLIVLGQVAKKYGLYTKITGGQRIDLFGAQKQDLPDIWEELVNAGFESGHAYGKSLRTVKSCVGTSWCRYGVGDSVGLAVQLEERYKSVRSPHKIKGGVSGCVRECAEAQSKDFGLIATDKGWNLFIGGNGGAKPRHATLFATDVPPSKIVRIIDRYLMFYIRTADKLTRTARWVESFDGGIQKLRKILLDDELGICADLEKEMDTLVGTYADEWAAVVNNPERRKQFRQFVNTDETARGTELIMERGQKRPADWPKDFAPVRMNISQFRTPRSQWSWRRVAGVGDLSAIDAGTTSVAVKYGDTRLAVFYVPKRGYYATQQMCPHKRAFVLDHGIISDDADGNLYVSCPMHKRNYQLDTGACLNDDNYSILAFEAKEDQGNIYLLLPDPEELDEILGSDKWMVKAATAQLHSRGGATQIELVGPDGRVQQGCVDGECSGGKLEW
ncbi:nitrite reductase [Ramaria rubella]|nr:nitrite reductase [Ramaria rubella]